MVYLKLIGQTQVKLVEVILNSTGQFIKIMEGKLMRAVVQRVSKAKVKVKGETIGKIGAGLVILLGIGEEDTSKEVKYLGDKILNLRIFGDQNDKMNLSALDQGADLLVVPNFTLYGDCSQGRRPDFNKAASPDKAEKLYKEFVQVVDNSELTVKTGRFKAMMDVELINDGPVTLVIDTDD